jgi:ribosomal protein L16 Arg81 hydroxylase
MLKDLLAPVSLEDFFREYWTCRFLHVPGEPDKFSGLYSWDALNTALENHRFDEKRLVLFHAGKRIDSDRYLSDRMVNAGKLTTELSNGATLIFNACEETWPALRELCASLEWMFHHRVVVNLYAGWRRDNGFNVHWDDQDNLILQVAGRKHWKVWNPTRQYPFKEDLVDTSVAPTGEPAWDGILEAGGLLSIPRGAWHVAYPLDEPSLHLTITIQNHTGIDLLRWLADQLKSSEAARMPIPLMAAPDERARWLERVRTDLARAWDDDLLDRYLSEVDAKAVPRPRISLPADADPRRYALKTTLLELAVPRPLRFSTQNGKTYCQASSFRWPMDDDVAEKLRGFNDRRPHTINDLSPTSDLRLSAVIGAMLMNGVLRRVAVPPPQDGR